MFLAEERTRHLRHRRPARLAAPDAAVVRAARRRPTGEPGPRLWSWTYAASQKVRNLERDPRATLQVEAGEQYQELRGVMLECDVRDPPRRRDVVAALGREIFAALRRRRAAQPPAEDLPPEVGEMVDEQALKRVGARVRRAAPRQLGSPQARRRLLSRPRPPVARRAR